MEKRSLGLIKKNVSILKQKIVSNGSYKGSYMQDLAPICKVLQLPIASGLFTPSTLMAHQSSCEPDAANLNTGYIRKIKLNDILSELDQQYTANSSIAALLVCDASASPGLAVISPGLETNMKSYAATLPSTISSIKHTVTEMEEFILLLRHDVEPIQNVIKVTRNGINRLEDIQASKTRYPDFLHPFFPPPEHKSPNIDDPPGVVRCRVGEPNPKRLRPGYDNMEERLCNKHSREAEFMMNMKIYNGKEERTHAWKCA